MNNRTEELEKLTAQWKKERPNYIPFCEDGILDIEAWDAASTKIMFLLKETYNHFVTIKGPMGPQGTSSTFWRRMRMWTHIIETHFQGSVASFDEVKDIKEEPNVKIAYVNIKKFAEKLEYNNEANSSYSDIDKYASEDSDLLSKQISFIDPDVIVCCGTFGHTRHFLPNCEKLASQVFQSGRTYLLDFGHLSQRNAYKNNYDELVEILKAIKINVYPTLQRTPLSLRR
jgi:hypothetical protein